MSEKRPRTDSDLDPLADELLGLATEVEPERDLWPSIAERLVPRPEPWWRTVLPQIVLPSNPWPALAALAAVAIAGVMLWPRQIDPPVGLPTASRPPVVATALPEAELASAVLVDTAHAEDGLLQLRRDLLESLERRRHELAPESIEIMEEALAAMDRAIGEVRLALATDPGNGHLNRRLAAQYRREVGLLIALNRI